MSTSQWSDAKRNCSGYKKQFQQKSATERTYAKLSLDDVIKLLDSASSSVRGKIIELRKHMSTRAWELRATVHAGGRGGDDELHFNILVSGDDQQKKVHYHIRCKAMKDDSVVVFGVTGK
jgi:hypothetical protein